MIKRYGTWTILLLLFGLDYFIVSNPENKTTTCVFWIALVVFQIWIELIKRRDE